ncbi:Penicillin-binding protein, transpeptidase [Candidatus Sulfopaludibacter sp. SbA3]|nr:Penicillin-binding protein, transpeptidase [Candidatus Sulfopaludibacter sp. SbA3]
MMLRREAIALLLAEAPAPRRAVVLLDVRTRRVSSARNADWIAPPGSTLKPLVFSVLLRAKLLDAAEKFLCTGHLSIRGRRFDCSHPPVDTAIDLRAALAYSCNAFTARVAGRLGPGELARGLERFGIGRTQAAATREATQLQALGEEGVLVTPMELALAYLQIAVGGERAILDGLKDAVEFGTAQRAAVPGLVVAGKTGSVRTPAGARIAWFAGFTPATVVVVMSQGRSGGADAAPVAADLLRGSVR